MKKLTFFLFVVSLALFRGQAHAQRCLPGMKGIRLTAGMADGFYANSASNNAGYSFGASLATYTKGYETVNGGKKLLFDGSTICNKDGFVYGGAVTLQVETYLTDRLVLLFYGRERCLWGGSTGHFHVQYGVGLKIMMD